MVRKALGAIFVVAVSAWSGVAQVQNFPTRPVTLIVPWVPGGPTDVAMRAIAMAREKYLGQAIIIEYRPSAAGTVGPIVMASTAKPDGYTIAQISENLFAAPFMTDMTFESDPGPDLHYSSVRLHLRCGSDK
jgi:tripartite-type tricarboxylate transporter receptor subunit TctC